MVVNKWNPDVAEMIEAGLGELVYRSNLIGSDRAVCNWGGGNTSMKTREVDFRGEEIDVLWVKGSGSDLASMKKENFTALKLADIEPLKEREEMNDADMVNYLSHCMLEPTHPRASIETLLHAFLPFKHVDHTHPDSIISLCCADNGRELANELFGQRFVWVPYIRPGFQLSKMIAEGVAQNPDAELVLMEKHGLVVWGDTAEESYHKTISVIQEAEAFIEEKRKSSDDIFGGKKYKSLPDVEERQRILSEIMPLIRGLVSDGERKMLVTYDDSDSILEFVNSYGANELSQVGAACPDHLVHTKRVPLFIDWTPESELTRLKEAISAGISAYQEEYVAYFERNAHQDDQMFEPSPRVVLIPGVGMINTGKSLANAQVSGALYTRAISVMRGTTALGNFVSLNEEESYEIEYWPLELYKLSLAPMESEFSRKVVFITGGAGGIGSETGRQFVEKGAHIVLADLNLEGAVRVASEINDKWGEGRALALKMDVTSEDEIQEAFAEVARTYGGVDVLVNNAGLATSSPFEETTLKEWQLNMDVLGTGYFLVAKEAFTLMKQQKTGGSMVFIGSKNSIYAGKNASAYSAVKAMEAHLARCIAAEGGEYGIRVNTVLPDAVLQGSAIWGSAWREERAAAYGIAPDQLEDHYKKRTTLGVNIYPTDIAESILFFASSKASKTTGCMLTVDGGVPAAFTR
ncbi:bifunctional rhamnulose-1-phosphate aldolase/short-chain dehydrogenase [Alkalihalobacillus pseudalcaliphilus]|uniref:bifunctional rhamnulose-1-phosphate aldolase/short-chain dehydrogenase n=1 Tax=Alkalihalobacillus pseudalcaliphilus TaxID=79884 RepID=UPI00064E0380|nr:bifunctional rhamnulose-1-phosphate aldolase/short-chain dehydrogenase [Alkalihalobacillus pseudalcaliphilus]KMK75077.1 short-chain dehydrogenase [Alkalihalobacillus pseudalcaliphilus]